MTKAFVLAETELGAREMCAGARSVADEVVLVTLGSALVQVADRCITVEIPEQSIADDAYETINALFDAEKAQVVFAEQTLRILSLVGRLAYHLGTSAITGVSALEGDIATSMYFGGTGIRKAQAKGEVALYTVGAGVFDGACATGSDVVQSAQFIAPCVSCEKQNSTPLPASGVDLAGADVVVACGRGFAEEQDLELARDLAAKLKGEVGCSRPLSEGVAWFAREAYIGVSGAVVAPKVYIAAGISGQMQHMVGCTNAGCVIAINKDKNAPIFKQCDLGFVGDIKTVLPALTEAL